MKTCVSSYSFGKYNETLGIKGIIDKAAEMGFAGIEFVEVTDDIKTAKEYGDYARSKGLEVVALCVGADFGSPDLDAEIERVKKKADIAAALGASLMRHDVIWSNKIDGHPVSYARVLPTLVKGCKAVTEYAKTMGIRTMTENHGFFSQDSARIEMLINAVDDPNFGALVDCGNYMCADEDPTLSVGLIAPYAMHVHVKDFHKKSGNEIAPGDGWFKSRGGNYLRGAIIGHGDAKVAQSIAVLKANGYDGYASIEFEGLEDNLFGIEIGLKNLRRFIG